MRAPRARLPRMFRIVEKRILRIYGDNATPSVKSLEHDRGQPVLRGNSALTQGRGAPYDSRLKPIRGRARACAKSITGEPNEDHYCRHYLAFRRRRPIRSSAGGQSVARCSPRSNRIRSKRLGHDRKNGVARTKIGSLGFTEQIFLARGREEQPQRDPERELVTRGGNADEKINA